ncbi:ABC transporter permease [Actinomadura scrupuli]|uniref:ABC transporter permease n=1 Tax=Actinomadura scrupuli TaxID=559629 RepID=UPI003D988AAD
MRARLRGADLVPLATIGLRSRRLRTALSMLGIAIGIAAVIAVLGITRSSQSELLTRIDRLGTNLLTVADGNDRGGIEVPLPPTARTSIARTDGVQQVAATAELPDLGVFRSDLIPDRQTGGIEVRAAETALLGTLDGRLASGTFLTEATARYPVVVLGHAAAEGLGISRLDAPTRVWLGERWFTVAGILQPLELAPEIDRAALIGIPVAGEFGYAGHPTRLYLRADTRQVNATSELLARAVNPEAPETVEVTRPSDVLESRLLVADSTTSLLLGLGAVALLVGGIGIANVMVISVLERRGEIGLRRALGATRQHIAAQFLLESLLLSALGGLLGMLLGILITLGTAAQRHWPPQIPATAIVMGPAAAVLIGALAGLYPAARAARLSPTDALRSV